MGIQWPSHPELKTADLVDCYVNKEMSTPEIKERFGMSCQAITERLKKVGIKMRSIKEALEIADKKGRRIFYCGEKHPRWSGGKYKCKRDGYIYIRNGRKQEHRDIWERANGKISDGYIIHHINGIRDDNRLQNLIALPRKRHSPMTIVEPHQKRIRILENLCYLIIYSNELDIWKQGAIKELKTNL